MSLTTRARLYVPLRDERGELLRYARVRVYQEDGETLFTGRIYRDGTSTRTYPNPFVAAPALVSVYFTAPTRIRLGVQPDTAKPERVSDVIDVTFDADQAVDTVFPLYVQGDWQVNALLCGIDTETSYWKPLRVDHEHEMVAPNTVLTGPIGRPLRQAGTFPGSTVLGADSGGWGAASSLRDASMLGSLADGYGRGTTAVGRAALAEEGTQSPWADGATAVGRDTSASTQGVALGGASIAGDLATAVGQGARGGAQESVALGRGARPAPDGVAIGRDTGALSRGAPGSIGLGAGAQYGLPSDQVNWAILLGAHDPSRTTSFPWANPDSSQSESPFGEYAPTMAFTGATVQLQRGLEWLADIAGLQVEGDATLGGPEGTLGFYGATPTAKPSLGDDEPGSGVAALDNLIFALRDLGLLRYRTEASMLYRAEDLRGHYLEGDRVREWPERFGTDTARAVPGQPPAYRASSPSFNGQPTVSFENSVYRRSTRPAAELRGEKLLPNEKHYIAVASHSGTEFGLNEGLLNLAFLTKVVTEETAVLTGEYGTGRWSPVNLARYERDGLNQTGNRDAGLPGAHVYAASHPSAWPHARPVIGGPRDNDGGWDRWSGQVAELVGMDATWEPRHVQSMASGLAFKYGINQPSGALRDPSRDFLLTQHDPMNGTLVFWSRDYTDAYLGKVTGRAIRVPKPVIYVPFISIYFAFSLYLFRGALVGNWGNLFFSHEYEASVSVKIGDLDGDGDLDVSTEFDVHSETHVGVFGLNNNFTWSMGQLSTRYGYKICRIRHRITKVVVCISGDPPFRYSDTDMKIYSTEPGGALRLEQTVPLWGDGTFKAWIKNTGKKVARVVERSTGNVLGTTEYQEKALPRTALYADDDPEVSFASRDRAHPYESALSALAILEMGEQHRYRARHILSTLRLVGNDDGTLNETYSAVLPAKAVPAGDASSRRWGAAWTILAVLRYSTVTGDGQFLAFARQLGDRLLTEPLAETRGAVAEYFALRDLAAATGVASYATGAQALRTALLGTLWDEGAKRFRESVASDAESLWATTMGGLFALAIGDRVKARHLIHHLKRFRVKGAQISAPHYAGPGSLIGYKPFADMGTTGAHVNPPTVIDQAGTWAAVLFKQRYGEPTGDDVASLYRWAQTAITSDPTHDLYSPQFLSHSANATTAPYSLRARPHLAPAAWGHVLAAGARNLFVPDPLPGPSASGPSLSISFDHASGRYILRYGWHADLAVSAAAYEALVEQSTDGGSAWSAASSGTVTAPLGTAVDASGGANAFAATWSTVPPENAATLFRVRIRLRNASIGAWTTSPSVGLPATS
jgi:hypothetical protein